MFSVFALCGTASAITLMVLANKPHSPLRDLIVQVLGWVFAAFCAIYLLLPIDFLPEAFLGPFGLPDDVAAAIAGFISAKAAWRAGKEREEQT